jgi:hypothetical protein
MFTYVQVNTTGAMGLANVVKGNLGTPTTLLQNSPHETKLFRPARDLEDACRRLGTD